MNKKSQASIILVIILIIAIVGIVLYLVLKPSPARCGDGICGPMKKARGICPEDCPVSNDGNNQNNIPNYIIVVHVNPVNVKELGSTRANQILSGAYQRTKQEV